MTELGVLLNIFFLYHPRCISSGPWKSGSAFVITLKPVVIGCIATLLKANRTLTLSSFQNGERKIERMAVSKTDKWTFLPCSSPLFPSRSYI